MRESLIYNDADDIQWAVTRNDSGITISRRTNVAHTRFAGTWKNVNVADAPAVVRAVVAVWSGELQACCEHCHHYGSSNVHEGQCVACKATP
jgi:hypothetical protein